MRVRWILPFWLAILGAPSLQADGPRPAQKASDPLARAAADPLALSLAVAQIGDDAVVAHLGPKNAVGGQLAAVLAARWMVAPELALGPLAELARGRDPDLAPAATAASWTILRILSVQDLDRREVDPASLAPPARAFEALAGDPTARADIRHVAGFIAASLRALGVPPPSGG